MIANDVLRGVRYALDLGDAAIVDTMRLADPDVRAERADVPGWLAKEEDAGFVQCPDPMLARFLDGLIVHYRGRDESRPLAPPPARLDNNDVLKKLRIAFTLKDIDLHEVFEAGGFPLSKSELSALFRQPGHVNYRPCGDQLLRAFLRGLARKLRAG